MIKFSKIMQSADRVNIRATLVCCVCSYEKFSGTPTNKEPVIMNIEQKVTHASVARIYNYHHSLKLRNQIFNHQILIMFHNKVY